MGKFFCVARRHSLKKQRLVKKDAIKGVVKVNGQGYSKDPFHSVTVVFEPC